MDFSAETLQGRRDWNDIFKSLRDKNFQPRILYPAKISFRYDGQIKTFPEKHKLREFVAMRSPLQEIFKKALTPEKKGERGYKAWSKEINRSTESEQDSKYSSTALKTKGMKTPKIKIISSF